MYKLIGENNLFDILGTVLKNRGIADTKQFLNPTKNDLNHYSKLKNIDKAVELLHKHIKKGSEVAVLVDSDP